MTLLLIAAKYNNLETFKYLVEKNCGLYATCTKMQNCLHYAVINKNKDFISYLTYLDSDNDSLRNEQNVRGQSPLDLDV